MVLMSEDEQLQGARANSTGACGRRRARLGKAQLMVVLLKPT